MRSLSFAPGSPCCGDPRLVTMPAPIEPPRPHEVSGPSGAGRRGCASPGTWALRGDSPGIQIWAALLATTRGVQLAVHSTASLRADVCIVAVAYGKGLPVIGGRPSSPQTEEAQREQLSKRPKPHAHEAIPHRVACGARAPPPGADRGGTHPVRGTGR